MDATRTLASLCEEREIPFIFTSTDLVFDGTKAPYSEGDAPQPINVYGEHKALAELEIMERHPLAAICRMPLMFGNPSPVHGSFLQWMLAKLQSGEALPLFQDEFRTPVDAFTAAKGLLMAASSAQPEEEEEATIPRISGLLHLGGRERVSRYEFGLLLQEIVQSPNARITAVNLGEVPLPTPRPPDVSLNSERAFGLGYDPKPLKEALQSVIG